MSIFLSYSMRHASFKRKAIDPRYVNVGTCSTTQLGSYFLFWEMQLGSYESRPFWAL